jgi:crotonobetainyl-CoA:carnitine CoA-transferase CaiB-like acyl-CoA transferase
VKLAATPSHIGGSTNRAAPNYGEDNEYVLGELLGMSGTDIKRLAAEGVI